MAGVTLKTVAKAVGVSPSTVSNAYNKPDQLSTALRERILATAQELGYAGPDASARALRSGKAGAVGVLFTDKLAYAFSDPYAVGFLAGLAEVAEEFATSLLLMPLSSTDIVGGSTPSSRPRSTRRRSSACRAVIRRSTSSPTAASPTVSTDRGDHPDLSWVAIDEVEAAAQLGEHLARLGHRDVVVLVDNARGSRRPAGGADARRGRVHRLRAADPGPAEGDAGRADADRLRRPQRVRFRAAGRGVRARLAGPADGDRRTERHPGARCDWRR